MSVLRRALRWFFGCGYYCRATHPDRPYIEITGARCALRSGHTGPHLCPPPFVRRDEDRCSICDRPLLAAHDHGVRVLPRPLGPPPQPPPMPRHSCDLPSDHRGDCWYESGTDDD